MLSELGKSRVLDEVPHLSADALAASVAFYRAFDKDGDGSLSPREFVTALKAYGRATGCEDMFTRKRLLDAFNSADVESCLLYTSPSPRDQRGSRMPSSA